MRAHSHPSTSTDDLVVVPRADLDQVLAESRALRQRVDALEQMVIGAPPDRERGEPEPTVPDGAEHGLGRRRALLGMAGVAAAGAAALAGPAQPAAAVDGSALIVTSNNSATGGTALTVSGTTASHGFAVLDQPFGSLADFPAALIGHATSTFEYGVYGLVTSANPRAAVIGDARSGSTGVRGTSTSGFGGSFATSATTGTTAAGLTASAPSNGGRAIVAGANTQLELVPNPNTQPPASGFPGVPGQLRWTNPGPTESDLWACIGAGTPGTWRKVVGLRTAGAFHVLPVPVRVYDSRPGTTPSQGPKTPLPAGSIARTIDLKHNGSTVPQGATGVMLTVLLVNADAGNGNFTVWANDRAKPQSNTLVWGGSARRFSSMAMTAVDATAKVKVDASLETDLVLDVIGYFR